MKFSEKDDQLGGYDAFEKIIHGILVDVNCFKIAKVVKYDKSKHIADVLPLANDSDGTESAQYLDLPVSENCYMLDEVLDRLKPEFDKIDQSRIETNFLTKYPKKKFMRKGVTVLLAILDRDNDNWSGKSKTYTPNTSRLHDPNDAIVIGVLGGNAVDG